MIFHICSDEDIFIDHAHELLNTLPSILMASDFNDAFKNDAARCDYTTYMSLLGKSIHIVRTLPDIAYAVSRLATRATVATDRDYISLLRIVAYLNGTKHLDIKYFISRWQDSDAAPKLFGYLDATYACHSDSKSHTGYTFGLGDHWNASFFSRTTKHNVTLSSTEAENAAAVEATKETLWFRHLLTDLGFYQLEPTVLYDHTGIRIQ